jgi:SAM-dependent methyltransferase
LFEMTDVPVRVPDEWFVGFHQGLAARFWRAAAAAMAEDDVRVVRRLLGDPPARVLDAPCGDGRMGIRLAAVGYETIGVDIAASEVAEARRAAADAGVAARFEVGDLRALPDVGRVDAVLSWGNSFGYLVPAETARSLAGLRAALRPGGRLVLESATVAETYLSGGVKPSAEWEYGGVRLTAENRYRVSESRLESAFTFADADGRVEHAQAAHHVHTSAEVVRMLRAAGFGAVELLGADGIKPYEVGSPRLIAVARCIPERSG